MRRWLARRFPHAPLNRAVEVAFDADTLTFKRGSGLQEAWKLVEVVRITIRTTDRGPFDDDVFLVIETRQSRVWIPQDVAGPILHAVQSLPGFDNERMIDAMSCTDNQEFLCWERTNST